MLDVEWNTLFTATATGFAIGIPLAAVATLRLGLGGRIRTMTYYQKRLSLMKSMLQDHRSSLPNEHVTALKAEIEFISGDLISSSPRFEAERVLDWKTQKMWKRFLRLPEPTSVAGWIANTVFYLYSLCAALYLLLGYVWLPFWVENGEPNERAMYALLLGGGLSVAIAAAARHWSLSIARNRVVMNKAKVIVAVAHGQRVADDADDV